MSEGEDVAKLWKVNRTIHELVKDRVSAPLPDGGGDTDARIAGLPGVRRRAAHGPQPVPRSLYHAVGLPGVRISPLPRLLS